MRPTLSVDDARDKRWCDAVSFSQLSLQDSARSIRRADGADIVFCELLATRKLRRGTIGSAPATPVNNQIGVGLRGVIPESELGDRMLTSGIQRTHFINFILGEPGHRVVLTA